MMTSEKIEKLKAAKKHLENIVAECDGNDCLDFIRSDALSLLKTINRCELFGIWSNTRSIEYGVCCGKYDKIPNCSTYAGGEDLLNISFPTGAYIFGERYDTKYFDEFFAELQDVPPDYIDKINHSLYYRPEKAAKAYEHYRATCKKYIDNNKARVKQWQIENLKKQLHELEGDE